MIVTGQPGAAIQILGVVQANRKAWLPYIRTQAVLAEPRRALDRYDTGTISEAACLYLRAVTEIVRPAVAVEIGTFIGTSALAMAARRVYTCDKSNDCGHLAKHIVRHPYTGSTKMLAGLAARGIKAGFFFFDGRIKDADERLILDLSTPETVYAFDDYEGREKGVLNVERLAPLLPGRTLILPPDHVRGPLGGDLRAALGGRTTIALLAP